MNRLGASRHGFNVGEALAAMESLSWLSLLGVSSDAEGSIGSKGRNVRIYLRSYTYLMTSSPASFTLLSRTFVMLDMRHEAMLSDGISQLPSC